VITNQLRPGDTIETSNSKTKGDVTETKILQELVARGYFVSIPFGDNTSYDLIAEGPEGTMYRLQCKTAWEDRDGVIQFNTHSQTTRDGEYYETGYMGSIDAFVVRYPEPEQFYWIDIAEATQRKMTLRLSEADIDHPSINWAEEYELDDEIPPPGAWAGQPI
jgi:hypothetical protein